MVFLRLAIDEAPRDAKVQVTHGCYHRQIADGLFSLSLIRLSLQLVADKEKTDE